MVPERCRAPTRSSKSCEPGDWPAATSHLWSGVRRFRSSATTSRISPFHGSFSNSPGAHGIWVSRQPPRPCRSRSSDSPPVSCSTGYASRVCSSSPTSCGQASSWPSLSRPRETPHRGWSLPQPLPSGRCRRSSTRGCRPRCPRWSAATCSCPSTPGSPSLAHSPGRSAWAWPGCSSPSPGASASSSPQTAIRSSSLLSS